MVILAAAACQAVEVSIKASSNMGLPFYYQIGKVSTTIPWNRPSYESVKNFLLELQSNTDILERYSVHITGGILYDFNSTWDVDLVLLSDNVDNTQLESDLYLMYDLALNTSAILIDVQWSSQLIHDISFSEITSLDFKPTQITHKKIGFLKKDSSEGSFLVDRRNSPDVTLIGEYLIELTRDYPTDSKIIDRIIRYPNRTLKASIPASIVLEQDYRYFFANTNR